MTNIETGRFRAGFAATLALDLLARGVAALTVIVMIAALDPAAYAFVAVFLAASQFLSSSLTSGLQMQFLRDEAETRSRSDTDLDHSGFRGYSIADVLVLVLVTSLVAAALGVGGVSEIGGVPMPMVALLVGSAAIAQSLLELCVAHFQARLRFRSAALWVLRNLLLFGVAVLALTSHLESGITVSAASSISTLVLAIAAAAWLWRRARPKTRTSHDLGAAIQTSGWMTLYFIGAAVFAYCDVIVVGWLLPATDVAAFGAAQRYFAIALGAFPALLAVMRVRTAQVDIVESGRAQRGLLLRWFRNIGPSALLLTLALELLAGVLVPILDGGKYPESVPVLRVLLIFALAAYLTAPAATLLMARERTRFLALSLTAAAVVSVVADVLVARAFGIVAVAAATTAIFVSVVCLQVWRLLTDTAEHRLDDSDGHASLASAQRAD